MLRADHPMSAAPALQPPLPPHPNHGELDRILPTVVSPVVRSFLQQYRAGHPPDRLPRWGDFDQTLQPQLQAHYLVVAPDAGFMPGQAHIGLFSFRIVAAGAKVARAFAFPLAGRLVSEIMDRDDPGFRYASAIAADVMRRGQMAHYRGPARLTDSERFNLVEYCSCPFAEDGHSVDHIVAVLDYTRDDSAP